MALGAIFILLAGLLLAHNSRNYRARLILPEQSYGRSVGAKNCESKEIWQGRD